MSVKEINDLEVMTRITELKELRLSHHIYEKFKETNMFNDLKDKGVEIYPQSEFGQYRVIK